MSFFSKAKQGMANVIRCDQTDFLVWKWRPEGQPESGGRADAIRFGSSLRVRPGQAAIFMYKKDDGNSIDVITGPHDEIIRTKNFPVLASIIGPAYEGGTPFQAEIYFLNMAEVVQMPFAVPYFEVFDPRFLDFSVPVAVAGQLTFRLSDPREFVKAHSLSAFSMERLQEQVRSAIARVIKDVVGNAPMQNNLPALQIERIIGEINALVEPRLKESLRSFAIEPTRLDIGRITIDRDSESFRTLYDLTAGQQAQTIQAQTEATAANIRATQEINARNMEETLRIQREESQRAQRLTTESQFIGTHALNVQANVMRTAAQSLGTMGGTVGGGEGSAGGFNPAALMSGMAVGGALGTQLAQMMNNVGQNLGTQASGVLGQQGSEVPPPIPGSQQFYLVVEGKQAGPFSMQELSGLIATGTLTPQTLAWTAGMGAWASASQVPGLAALFISSNPGLTPPPIPEP